MRRLGLFLGILVGLIFFVSLIVITFHRGESLSAAWILLFALSGYFVGYRFYSYFIAYKGFQLSDDNPTPAHKFYNGYDYVPTNKWVVLGHHFAAISGAGPLVGPVLAAQMGYLPSALWIVFGVLLAGAVQDMTILIISLRKDGRSLGDIVREELGRFAGWIALFGIYSILGILVAVLALVVVKALAQSPWGTFTVFMTIPIAMLMGIYMWKIRPGSVVPATVFGILALIGSLILGRYVALDPFWGNVFTLNERFLAIALIVYGFVASVLPIWLLLAPRDYLSTFLKIGTVIMLAIGIFLVLPEVRMPAITQFIHGNGPVWKGEIFPFLFITIACGAVSGFHSLVSSGTTPKLIDKETDARLVGYLGMIGESFVAIMALIAAVTMEPGLYFAINSPASEIGRTVEQAVKTISSWGFVITPEQIEHVSRMIEEKTILSRTGGAPSLAIGMALIFSKITGEHLMAFWYHFIILFEAVFILTTIDAGTRIGRYVFQDLAGLFVRRMRDYSSLLANFVATTVTVLFWGYFLYAGVVDPYGGIKTLWPIFGIANQLLAAIALITATVYLINRKRFFYAIFLAIPALFLTFNTSYAGILKIFHPDPNVGLLAHMNMVKDYISKGMLPPKIESFEVAQRVIFNDAINVFMTSIYVLLVALIFVVALRRFWEKLNEGTSK